MSITKKLRFEVLSRDGYCCMYCGRKPPYVTLEVDHIVPKKKGGNNSMDNLKTACFDCNRGKGSETEEGKSKSIYKSKIKESKLKAKSHFYDSRNKKYLGTVTKDTSILLNMFIDYRMDMWKIQEDEYKDKFMLGGDTCDFIIYMMYDDLKFSIDCIIKNICDDSIWNKERKGGYGDKLNYELTDILSSAYSKEEYYILHKFTLFHDLLNDE